MCKRESKKCTFNPYERLIQDCWDSVFDYLTIEQIFKVSESCQDLQQICGVYLSRFPYVKLVLDGNYFTYEGFKLNVNYSRHVRRLKISERVFFEICHAQFTSFPKHANLCSLGSTDTGTRAYARATF